MIFIQPVRLAERGTITLEFTLCAAAVLTMIVGIIAGGNLFWTHNALVDATRRGARYASLQCNPNDVACLNNGTVDSRIRNVVVYGTDSPAQGATPLVPYLQTSNVTITRANDPASPNPPFGVGKGTVTVKITDFQYAFVIPGVNQTITLPPYASTISGECAGYVPPDQ
jgi:Flp pilus assembly protein TadG